VLSRGVKKAFGGEKKEGLQERKGPAERRNLEIDQHAQGLRELLSRKYLNEGFWEKKERPPGKGSYAEDRKEVMSNTGRSK